MSPKILLINRIPTHHQMPLANRLHDLCGDNFKVVFCKPVSAERLKLGWEDMGAGCPWVIRLWESENAFHEFSHWLDESDAIVGFPPQRSLLINRLKKGKLCLLASERIWKPSRPLWRMPETHSVYQVIRHYYRNLKYIMEMREISQLNCHMLAIGAYSAWDFSRINVFTNKLWTYGYFVSISDSCPIKADNGPLKILWAGGMLRLKCVDQIINALSRFKDKDVTLKIIGTGPEEDSLKSLANNLGLGPDKITFLPVTSPEGVRRAMDEAHIYVQPSTYEEGWGAVINEAMAQGCAVLSSEGVGAAKMLIKQGETGFIFPNGNVDKLAEYIGFALANRLLTINMGREAWSYVKQTWSPEIAAERLVALIKGLAGYIPLPHYKDGPCSSAPIIKPGVTIK